MSSSACTDPFGVSFRNLPLNEKETWLDNNPNHEMHPVALRIYVSCLAEQFSQLQIHSDQLKKKNDQLEEEKGQLKEEKGQLEEKVDQLEEKVDRLEETVDQQKKENHQQKEEIDQRSAKTLQTTYPKLIDRTASPFHWPEKAPHAEVEQIEISEELFESFKKNFMTQDYWEAPFIRPQKYNCDSEAEICGAVKKTIETNIAGLGLKNVIEVCQNRTLAGAECDLLLVYKPNRLPFAALEIKKPPNTLEDRDRLFNGEKKSKRGERVNRVAGEVWAEINGVRLFGFEKVYGMISTHNQFRLVCTDNINDESDNVDAMRKSWEELKKRNENFKGEQMVDESSNEIVTPPGKKSITFVERDGADRDAAKLFASQIIPNLDDAGAKTTVEESGENIMQLVALFILKACTTLTKLLNKNGGTSKSINLYKRMPCRTIEDGENEFAFGTISFTKEPNFDQFTTAETIYVIHHLGMGNSGNCCLGVSAEGKTSCAVKFYHQPGNRVTVQVAETEYKNWQNIYGDPEYGPPMARKFKLAEGNCLVMPYLKSILDSDRHTLLESKIEETLRKFAKTGYTHGDVKWRHFGYWGEEIFLIDLENVAEVETNEIDSWVNKTLKKLRQKAGGKATRKRKK